MTQPPDPDGVATYVFFFISVFALAILLGYFLIMTIIFHRKTKANLILLKNYPNIYQTNYIIYIINIILIIITLISILFLIGAILLQSQSCRI
jgi:hypothetical protein